jgi:transposase
MQKYPVSYKERVVREYEPGVRGKGFKALGNRYNLAPRLIKLWWKKWEDGGRTREALEQQHGGGRRSKLTDKEKEKHILEFVNEKNAMAEPVDYLEVHENVIATTHKEISLRTIQEIGKEELGLTWKKGTIVNESDGKFMNHCT